MISLRIKKNELDERIFVGVGDEEDFRCSFCNKKILEGYMCEGNDKKVLCPLCQDELNMSRCKHDKRGEHKHIKFIKSNGK